MTTTTARSSSGRRPRRGGSSRTPRPQLSLVASSESRTAAASTTGSWTTPWRDSATCRGHNPDWWFATRSEVGHYKAEVLCRACPVRDRCLEEQLHFEQMENDGVAMPGRFCLLPAERQALLDLR